MRTIGNILWFIFAGIWLALGYAVSGLLMCLTIIGIPFGLRVISLGVATLAPFGKEVVYRERGDGCLPLLFNIIWIVLFGWEIALAHLIGAGLLAITIVGIPFAKQHIKLIPISFAPFSYDLK